MPFFERRLWLLQGDRIDGELGASNGTCRHECRHGTSGDVRHVEKWGLPPIGSPSWPLIQSTQHEANWLAVPDFSRGCLVESEGKVSR